MTTADISSDSDFELIQNDDVINLQKNFNNLQVAFNEMKNNNALIKNSFENEVKMLLQNFNSKNEDKIEEIKQTFKQMFGELMSENNKKFNELKEIICKKGEKIVCLGNNFEQYFNVIPNKWKDFYRGGDYYDCYKCCEDKCINADNPKGVCVKGNGFVNLIDDENIKYISCVKGKGNLVFNRSAFIFAENSFNKPTKYLTNYSLFYFEIKFKIEGEAVDNDKDFVFMGLYNNKNYFVELDLNQASILCKTENKQIKNKFKTFSLNDGDVYGCGLVYPPNNKILNEFPFIFFTQNGKLIGKIISLKNFKCDFYKPYVALKCCSVETNFGNNLKEKPFLYKIKNNFNQFSVNFDDEEDESLDFDGELTKEETEKVNGSAGNVSN
uniref:Uncharacterized protein n=1 Tax=Meloidogyne enterolobii TaxID=390850 RepID=A0A6V7TZY6_MELEN|nr:unnamed protein product [Meloidogyne enterolobii]